METGYTEHTSHNLKSQTGSSRVVVLGDLIEITFISY